MSVLSRRQNKYTRRTVPVTQEEINDGRRFRRVKISYGFMLEILRGGFKASVTSNVPEDIRVVFVDQSLFDCERQVFDVWISSSSFEPVPPGEVPPTFDVTFTCHG